MTEKKIGYKDVFCQAEYMKMILASLINRFGDSIDEIASTWIVYELSGNAAWSAIIYGVNKIPTVLITPLAGAWVEGRKKKTIMIVTDLIRALCVAFVATGYLMGFLQAWMLLITTFTISTVEAFRGPANSALTPRVLDKECYEYGMSLMSTLGSIVELIGAAIAAGIIAIIGTAGAIYVDMATFTLSALIIMTVNSKEHELKKQKFDRKEYVNSLLDGFKYVKKDKLILFISAVAIFLNAILVPLNSLQAPMASEILHGGAEVLSILGIASTLGMLLGSFTFPMLQKKLSDKLVLILGALGIAAFYIGIPLFEPFYSSKIFMYGFVAFISAFFGFVFSLCNTFLNVKTLKRIDESYLARIGGIMTASSVAFMPITSFLIGILVANVSTAVMFVISGILAVCAAVYVMFTKVLDDDKASEMEVLESGAGEVLS